MKHKFKCGCEFESTNGKNLILDLNPDNLRLDCPGVWAMLAKGLSKGVFQLESNLGRHWVKVLKPVSVAQLGALTALIRPGVLEAKNEKGKSMTQLYCDRKNGIEPLQFEHPALEPILKDDYGILVFQEAAIKIAKAIGGFSLQKADDLRKAMGKKDAELMAKVREQFLTGCKEQGIVDEDTAKQIFDNVQKSQRYAFNRCISGSTIIKKSATNNSKPLTVEEMYRIKTDIHYAKATGHLELYKKYKRQGYYGKSWSLNDDGRLRPNKIVDIKPAGVRAVYLVELANGSTIKVTANHKFPTLKGELRLEDLAIGDSLLCCIGYDKSQERKYGWSNLIQDLNRKISHDGSPGFNKGENNPGYTNGEWTKFQANKAKLPSYCAACSDLHVRLETHHKDGNRLNNELDNLEKLCPGCHKKKEYANGRRRRGQKGYLTEFVQITSIKYIGQEETYDVTMAAPNHTFTTETGIVTCNSHSMEYGLLAYATAYCKFHFPLRFFCSSLQLADSSLDPKTEISELVNDARLFDIPVLTTDFRDLKDQFYIVGKSIRFGIVDTEGIGGSVFYAIVDRCQKAEELLQKKLADFTWTEILVFILSQVNRTAVLNLIEVGAFDYTNLSRTLMAYEYGMVEKLTEKELDYITTQVYPDTPDLLTALRKLSAPKVKEKIKVVVDGKKKTKTLTTGGGCSNVKREAIVRDMVSLLENPPYSLRDSFDWIAWIEEKKLGVSITSHKTDACDLGRVTCTCKEFLGGYDGYIVVGVSIKSVREVKVKRGKNAGEDMAMLSVNDGTCQLESVVCFCDEWKEFSNLLTEGNLVAIRGERTQTGSLAVKKVWQL